MSAWHKALKNVQEYEPAIEFSIHCRLVEEGCLCKGTEYYGDEYHESDLALKKMVRREFEEIGDGFWSCVDAGRQRSECLTLLEICTNAVTDHGQALRDEMASLRFSCGSATEQTTSQ